ncbi:MAG: sporulation protein YabP [Clostridium sp.]|mgnify:CR=1 FL=1|nr:sporulation protein YabP [Clostridium sp.]
MDERVGTRPHKVNLLNRGVGAISGVREVKAFNETEIVLETDMGTLSIKGTELHVTKLTLEKGEVEVDGVIDSFVYTDTKEEVTGKGVLGRLFR